MSSETEQGASSRPSAGNRGLTSRPSGPLPGKHSNDKAILAARGALPDVEPFGKVLGRVVKGSRVDYAAVVMERATIDEFLAGVAKTDLSKVDAHAKLAFYINAYNAKTLALVVEHVLGRGKGGADLAGVLEVKKAKGFDFFKEKTVIVGGDLLSLDELEGRGRKLGDPRIHFAVNCASVSCPALLNRAWKPETLDADLTTATKTYLASEHGSRIIDGLLHVTKLFEWYVQDWGSKENVRSFLQHYAPDRAKDFLDRSWGYLDYDWNLNRS